MQPAELIVSVIDVSVWMCVIKLFSNHYFSSYSFSQNLAHDHTVCANMQKTAEQIFEVLIKNFLVDLVSGTAAVELSRSIGRCSLWRKFDIKKLKKEVALLLLCNALCP